MASAASTTGHGGVTRVVVPSPTAFDRAFAEHCAGDDVTFVLVEGAKDATTGHSWCSDCVRAEPVMERVLAEAAPLKLLVCPVKREEYKGNASYYYRTHPQLKITSVPTLIRVRRGKAIARAVEGQCADEGFVRDVVSDE